MYTKTQRFTLTGNKQTGEAVESQSGNLLASTASGDKVWFPAKANVEKYITYTVHEKGDTFVATSDSSRTKGDVMGDDAPKGKEDEPLFLEGETVTRTQDSIEWIGFTSEEIKPDELTFEQKATILAKLGVKISLQ